MPLPSGLDESLAGVADRQHLNRAVLHGYIPHRLDIQLLPSVQLGAHSIAPTVLGNRVLACYLIHYLAAGSICGVDGQPCETICCSRLKHNSDDRFYTYQT